MRLKLAGATAFLATGLIVSSASGDATIVLDFTNDTFFQSNATAMAALNAAANDLSAALTSSLGATTDTSSGTFAGSTAIFNFSWSYSNPATGANTTFDPTVLPANEIRIFVGARNLSFPTLGIGGPGGIAIGGSGTFSNQSEWDQAVAIAAANATANQGRGGGPIIFDDVSGTFSGAPFSIDFGSTIGSFTVDNDADWHFDHTTPVDPTRIDLYSVALHELLHAVGFGTADSWEANVSGGVNWTGAEVIAHFGTGTGVVDNGSGHGATGLMSQRISDGVAQEIVMDPDIAPGQRKFLTFGDLAFLADSGWQTAIPEPASAFAVLGLAGVLVLRRRRAA